jgi:hypothetical protein
MEPTGIDRQILARADQERDRIRQLSGQQRMTTGRPQRFLLSLAVMSTTVAAVGCGSGTAGSRRGTAETRKHLAHERSLLEGFAHASTGERLSASTRGGLRERVHVGRDADGRLCVDVEATSRVGAGIPPLSSGNARCTELAKATPDPHHQQLCEQAWTGVAQPGRLCGLPGFREAARRWECGRGDKPRVPRGVAPAPDADAAGGTHGVSRNVRPAPADPLERIHMPQTAGVPRHCQQQGTT